jgi:hypothetical protein
MLKRPSGFNFCDARAAATVFHPFLFNTERGRGLNDRAAQFAGARSKDFQSFRPLLRQNGRNPLLENTRLFRGDFRKRMTEKVFVIEIHARDDRDDRSQDICRIQATTQPYLEYAEVNPRASKIFERHRRHAFKVRRMRAKPPGRKQLLVQSLNARKRFCKRVVADLFAVHANALVDFLKMR